MILWSARFSAALCRGLIEAIDDEGHLCMHDLRFPRLYAAASLKPLEPLTQACGAPGFPRLYAAASLKLIVDQARVVVDGEFSAALCRGLIEA